MQLFTIAAMLVAALGVIFALQNSTPVDVTFLLWYFHSSLALVLLLALAIGAFIIALISTPSTLSKQWAATRLNKRIAELEATCNDQADKIVELKKSLQDDKSVNVSGDPRPYIGLKQIIAGAGNDER